MARSLAAIALVVLLLTTAACGWTSRNFRGFGLFKGKAVEVCSLSEAREYEEALEAARSMESGLAEGRGGLSTERSQAGDKKAAGKAVVHKFVIRNTSKAPLRIERIVAGCGGSVERFDRSIPPGKEGVVMISWNPEGCDDGDMKFGIVVADDPLRPAVVLKSRTAKGS